MSKKIQLSKINTRAPKVCDKEVYKLKTAAILEELDAVQNLLYAEHKHSILLVIQGMDASGKDGLTKDVFGSMNPQGVRVSSYKVPTEEERNHDFLWRIHKNAPEKGMIHIFNRSHYEDILVTRVHGYCDKKTATKRMEAINDFEKLLTEHNDTTILKLYLHISQERQHERLKERMELPHKMWKYNQSDFAESERWDEYRNYYEEAFEKCNDVPWHIIPADQNWYKSYLVAVLLRDTLKSFNMKFPGLKQE